MAKRKAEWLDSYATDRHDWHEATVDDTRVHYRRIGIVEGLFNTDGIDYEGRADLTIDLSVELKTSLTRAALRDRILHAWAIMRQKHILLSSRVVQAKDILSAEELQDGEDWLYLFKPSTDPQKMLVEAKKHIVFVEDRHPDTTAEEFFVHLLNSSRCIDVFESLSRLYVMPHVSTGHDSYDAHFIFIAAHEIVDGLTSMRWMSSFIDTLNRTSQQLSSDSHKICSESASPRLPPAQESLYPSMGRTLARQRWSWVISRILRHTKRSPPASFQNPLRRRSPLPKPNTVQHEFTGVIDYSREPPLNTYRVRPTLSAAASRKMAALCRQARISIGSGCFALVALVMMLFEEQRNPDVPIQKRLPFVGSFPVNPRPFLDGTPTTGKEDNLMLAFSEGIALPFLPSDLDFEGRFRLLGKQAHRHLRQYQKRPRNTREQIELGSRNPDQLLPMLYLATVERLESKSVESRRKGWNIQGGYPAKVGTTLATCGISSVGARGSIIRSGKYNVTELPAGQDIAVDFRGLDTTVRARDGEFLVGAVGDDGILKFGVSYDGCAIDPVLANEWKHTMETILEPHQPSTSKL